jgi:hypothetical protein
MQELFSCIQDNLLSQFLAVRGKLFIGVLKVTTFKGGDVESRKREGIRNWPQLGT